MSILGMDLTLKTKTFGGDVEFLDSQQVRFIRGGITIDSGHAAITAQTIDGISRKIVKAGTILGKVTASGKMAPYKNDATDGTETAVCILMETVEVTGGYDAVTTAMDHGRVIAARLTGYDANAKTDLAGQIQFV